MNENNVVFLDHKKITWKPDIILVPHNLDKHSFFYLFENDIFQTFFSSDLFLNIRYFCLIKSLMIQNLVNVKQFLQNVINDS